MSTTTDGTQLSPCVKLFIELLLDGASAVPPRAVAKGILPRINSGDRSVSLGIKLSCSVTTSGLRRSLRGGCPPPVEITASVQDRRELFRLCPTELKGYLWALSRSK